MTNEIAVFFLFGTPLVAIAGGILAGILRTRGQQRLMELAQRERIAAIEKGLDPGRLPPLVPDAVLSPRAAGLRRVQGLIIGGMVSIAIGAGLIVTMLLLPAHDGGDAWPVGFVPAFVGVALLVSAGLVRRTLD